MFQKDLYNTYHMLIKICYSNRDFNCTRGKFEAIRTNLKIPLEIVVVSLDFSRVTLNEGGNAYYGEG